MWYIITGIISCLLIIINKKGREVSLIKYLIISLLLPPLGYGMWQAEKPLLAGEDRYGGKGWNIMKYFALYHTFLCIIWAIWALGLGAEMTSDASNKYEEAGAAIGATIGIVLIAGIWFGGVIGSLLLGVILKKPVTENGNVEIA